MNKNANLEKVCKQLFQKEDSSHIEYKCMIIGRMISIKVLYKSSYPNTLIKDEV